jgi:hypothetical protein
MSPCGPSRRAQRLTASVAIGGVARANTARKITLLRDLSEEQFREHLRRSNDPGRRYIVNFSREKIFGRRRASFADWRLSRARGPSVHP